MVWAKRIVLFLVTNILVMLTITILVLGLGRGLGGTGWGGQIEGATNALFGES